MKLTICRANRYQELWRLVFFLNNLEFFNNHDYDISTLNFPLDNPTFVSYLNKKIKPTEKDYDILLKSVDDACDDSVYTAGIALFENIRNEIEGVFPRFKNLNDKWGFQLFDEYTVVISRYGYGGYYDHKNGIVTIGSSVDGKIGRLNPLQMAVHELVHIGVEEPIVKKYNLSHSLKERLVDRICAEYFSDILPNYFYQEIGEPSLDQYVTMATIDSLPSAIERFNSSVLSK